MKSFLGAYLAGGMSVLGIWLVYENKQKIDTMVKNVMNKADQMIQEMKCSTLIVQQIVTITIIKN